MTCAFAISIGLLGAGCSGGREAAEALAAAEPFVTDFSRYDAWARRALAARSVIGDADEQLEETLFAPLLLESQVVDAWVIRRSEPTRAYALRGLDAPAKRTGWRDVEHPSRGALSILEGAIGDESRCVVISREQLDASGAPLRVIVAFRAAAQ